ncbi:DEAD/DEAH box helicase [Aliikangiella sp. G2MR2-5]|uniref:DEAD/DEAH box helicase n=1 Tax=Aliikangiella sp. G2MR2-5 TaxID=2788943 RepID=UPI0018AC426F|nr:DEAD/DEAH box helicase [Aliikangiella sp. G2MR2-5]
MTKIDADSGKISAENNELVQQQATDNSSPKQEFSSLLLKRELLRALTENNYVKPTPIQLKVIPAIQAGHDLMASAQTGTGKTAAFILPILNQLSDAKPPKGNQVKALVLVPTRELALQVHQNAEKYGLYTGCRSLVVYGGVKINPQMMKLRKGASVLIATPGRLLDLMDKNAVKFDELQYLVLDEADRMLDMGFLPDIERIKAKLPQGRQTLLLSATFSETIKQLSKQFLNHPLEVEVTPANTTARTVDQWFHPVEKSQKTALLSYLIGHHRWEKALIFVKTKKGANKLAYDLEKSGIKSTAIHGDKKQGARNRALSEFKAGKVQALVATDVAARGLDIEQMPLVVNYELPKVAEDYVHRIGRTGRAGEAGQAISLISMDEIDLLKKVQSLIGVKLKKIGVSGFKPEQKFPDIPLVAAKKKKPHKKKIAKAKIKAETKKRSASRKKQVDKNSISKK